MLKRLLKALFGPCLVDGHQWVWVPPTVEQAKLDEEAYRDWFDNYPIVNYSKPHGHHQCSICGDIKL